MDIDRVRTRPCLKCKQPKSASGPKTCGGMWHPGNRPNQRLRRWEDENQRAEFIQEMQEFVREETEDFLETIGYETDEQTPQMEADVAAEPTDDTQDYDNSPLYDNASFSFYQSPY